MGKKQPLKKKPNVRLLLENPQLAPVLVASEEAESKILDLFNTYIRDAYSKQDTRKALSIYCTMGLNGVTRSVERGEVCCVLLEYPVPCEIMVQPLRMMCVQHDIPLLHIKAMDVMKSLSGFFSLLAVGIKNKFTDDSNNGRIFIETVKREYDRLKAAQSTIPLPLPQDLSYSLCQPKPVAQPTTKPTEDFVPLNQHPVFPNPDYPKELDTIEIRINSNWLLTDLDAGEKTSVQTPSVKLNLHGPLQNISGKKRYLVEPQFKSVVSSGKAKKQMKKK